MSSKKSKETRPKKTRQKKIKDEDKWHAEFNDGMTVRPENPPEKNVRQSKPPRKTYDKEAKEWRALHERWKR